MFEFPPWKKKLTTWTMKTLKKNGLEQSSTLAVWPKFYERLSASLLSPPSSSAATETFGHCRTHCRMETFGRCRKLFFHCSRNFVCQTITIYRSGFTMSLIYSVSVSLCEIFMFFCGQLLQEAYNVFIMFVNAQTLGKGFCNQ